MIEKFPYGKAPFWLLVMALLSTALLVVTRRERPPRADLVFATFAEQHKAAYEREIPRFEREHGVRVSVELVNQGALQTRLQNALLAGTETPDLVEIGEGTLGFFTRGPAADIGFLDLTDRLRKEGYDKRLVSSRFSLWQARGRIYGIPHDVHPVALVYRRDLVEKLGIDVNALDTWEEFVAAGQRVIADKDGDGILDQYMIDMPYDGGFGLEIVMRQRGTEMFDEHGNVSFNTEDTAEAMAWYMRQTFGPKRIGYECGWGQSLLKSMTDGLALFYWAPDWRTFMYQHEVPLLAGKMAIMPLPAWKAGGRRTSVWGGTGLTIAKRTKNPDLAWDLAKFLYFDPKELGKRFSITNIVPPLKDAWDLPEFNTPNAYYSGQKLGRIYAELAPHTPRTYTSPVDTVARAKVNEAYGRALVYFKAHGEEGLMPRIHAELDAAEAYVKSIASRQSVLLAGKN